MTSRSSTTTSCSRADVARELYHRVSRATCRSSTTTATCRSEQIAADHRFRSHHRDLAGRRPLQVAGHARERRARALLHGRRVGLGEVRGLGAHGARHAAQPALPLDAHGAAAPVRHRRAALPRRPPATIFERCNALLARAGFTTLGLLREFRVAVVCTTDDPADSLEHHAALARREDPGHARLPDLAARPGARRRRPRRRSERLGRRGWRRRPAASSRACDVVPGGARRAAPGVPRRWAAAPPTTGSKPMLAEPYADAEVAAAFDRAARRPGARRRGEALRLKSALLHRLALMDHARGWVQQFHLGALRNNNTRLRRALGARLRLRLHRRLRAGAAAGAASSTASTTTNQLAQDDPLQPEPARQRAVRHA